MDLKFTKNERIRLKAILGYYRDIATHHDHGCCGLDPDEPDFKLINRILIKLEED